MHSTQRSACKPGQPGEALAPHTWMRIGGPAEFFARPRNVEELAALVKAGREADVPARLLGGGSNVLIRDEGAAGLVISLEAADFCAIRPVKGGIVAGGGAKLGHAISVAVREGLAGLESLVGIPGTIGGALHGNAGGKGGDVGQWVAEATLMTRAGEIVVRKHDEMVFSYRESNLDELVIVEARFELDEGDATDLTRRMQQQWIVKKANQPLGHQSAGCIFKNPRGMSAGMLIDQAGLKGTRVGGAEVSDRHANFIVADPGTKASDVLKLVDQIREKINERLGVELELEIEVW